MKQFEIEELKKVLNNLEIVIGDLDAVLYTSGSDSVSELVSELGRQKVYLSEIIDVTIEENEIMESW